MKQCKVCGRFKELTEFFAASRGSQGRRAKCKVCEPKRMTTEQNKKSYEKHKLAKWATDIKRWYGITPFDYYSLVEEQRGLCAICGGVQVEGRKRLCIDHYAKTSTIRGLLCGQCNKAIGLIKDDPQIAQHMTTYLSDRND